MRLSAVVCAVLVSGVPFVSEGEVPEQESGSASASASAAFTELHRRAREVEKTLVTMRADFVETTESDLLAEPIVERGRLVAVRPLRVLMRYEEPEKKALLIDDEELRLLWFERGNEEKISIGKMQEAVDKYFYRASEKELRSHFDFEVVKDPEAEGMHRVNMIAKRKQVKKGIERLNIWIDEESLLPVKMQFVYPEGAGSKTIELSNVRTNVEVDETEFELELPTDTGPNERTVTVTVPVPIAISNP